LAEVLGYTAPEKPSFVSQTLLLFVGACLITCCTVVLSTGTVGDRWETKSELFESQWESDCLEINDKGFSLETCCCLAGDGNDGGSFESLVLFQPFCPLRCSHLGQTGDPRSTPTLEHALTCSFLPCQVAVGQQTQTTL